MKISLKTWDGKHYLCAEPSGRVVANRTQVGAWEYWTLSNLGGDTHTLQSAHGRYLCAEPSGLVVADRQDAGPWESWRLVQAGEGLAFISSHGLCLCAEGGGGGVVVADRTSVGPWETWFPSSSPGSPDPDPGVVRLLKGRVGVVGRSFGDATGARVLHGCSDFGAIKKYHEDRDQMLRQLDVVAQHQQYVRILWRLNGSLWEQSGVTNDPIRDPWFDDAFRGYLQACWDRGLRVNLSSGDFYHWSHQQALECFRRIGQIAASVSREVVWLSAATNEARGTMPGRESDENVRWMAECLKAFKEMYPWALLAGSDPESQDKDGMIRLAPSPANVALIHDVRHSAPDALRRVFNTMFENYPDKPVSQDEHTGPEDPAPPGPFNRKVYQPTENHDELFAIYTMHVLTGQASTYFNDPALYSRRPLDETWGFKELPKLWRDLEIPEGIGQGELCAGQERQLLEVEGSHASRADGMKLGGYGIGCISGKWDGQPWKVRAAYGAAWSVWYADGKAWEGRLSQGQVIPTPRGFTPAVVRALS